MQGELRETQTTPVLDRKCKGKEREVVVFSDVEELDGPLSFENSKSGPLQRVLSGQNCPGARGASYFRGKGIR